MKDSVFLFAFANDSGKTLRLEEEERQLRELLAPLHDQGQVQFLSLGSTSLDDIYQTFNRLNNRISIFHYSGHSDGGFLHLKDTGARADNIAQLIGMQNQMKLVFLNGCSNQEQVKVLFDSGVEVVIATKADIEDKKALDFSKIFYQSLAGGKNIKESFDTASSYVKNETPDLEVAYRSIVKKEPLKLNDLEWGLYSTDDTLLTWVIPAQEEPGDQEYVEEVELVAPDINKELVHLSLEGLALYKEDCKAIWDIYQKAETPALFNTIQNMMLASYPSSLSIQLRDLFTSNVRTKGRLRLIELLKAYLTLLKLLVCISIADLWNSIYDPTTSKVRKGFKIRPEYKEDLKKFIELSDKGVETFDFGWLLSSIYSIFKDNDKKPFIEESEKILSSFTTYDENYQAYSFLEQKIRSRLIAKNIDKSEVEDLCIDGEKHLGVLLRTCAFLSSYQLVTVKDIEVNLPIRATEPDFVHQSAILIGDNYQIQTDVAVSRKSFTNNNSVLITKDIADSDEHLNLSPFVIDENAYKRKSEKLPKIFFFKGWGENESIHFELAETLKEDFVIEKEPDLKTYKEELSNIRDQLQIFREDIFS